MEKRLHRSRSNRVIGGVCGGLGEYFGIDPVIVRIIFGLLVLANGIGILAYIILAIVVPLESSEATTPKETMRKNVEEMKKTANELGREIRSTLEGEEGKPEEEAKVRRNRLNLIGIIIIAVGILFLLGSL